MFLIFIIKFSLYNEFNILFLSPISLWQIGFIYLIIRNVFLGTMLPHLHYYQILFRIV